MLFAFALALCVGVSLATNCPKGYDKVEISRKFPATAYDPFVDEIKFVAGAGVSGIPEKVVRSPACSQEIDGNTEFKIKLENPCNLIKICVDSKNIGEMQFNYNDSYEKKTVGKPEDCDTTCWNFGKGANNKWVENIENFGVKSANFAYNPNNPIKLGAFRSVMCCASLD